MAERYFPTSEVRSSNQVIGKLINIICILLTDEKLK